MWKLTVLAISVAAFACVQVTSVRVLGPPVDRRIPRCPSKNGLYPLPEDCTSYLKCRNGEGKVRKCPEGFKFDSVKYCTPNEADCGRPTLRQSRVDGACLSYSGYFPYPFDCHKYVFCREGRGQLRSCPDNQVYVENVGCIESDTRPPTFHSEGSKPNPVCFMPPETGPCFSGIPMYYFDVVSRTCMNFTYGGCQGNDNRFETEDLCMEACGIVERASDDVICKEAFGKYSIYGNCKSYIACNRGVPEEEQCPEDEAFDIDRLECVPESEAHCDEPSNDILSIVRN